MAKCADPDQNAACSDLGLHRFFCAVFGISVEGQQMLACSSLPEIFLFRSRGKDGLSQPGVTI